MADQTLAQMVRAKYPGVYDQLSDQQLESAVRAKYPGTYDRVPSTPIAAATEEQPSALERGATQFYEKSPLAAAVSTGKGILNALPVTGHPLDTFFGLKPLAGTVRDLAKAQWDQAVQAAQKAKEAANGGGVLSASEAFGHGLAAVLPILGPAAADVGEHFAQGDIAGGVGGTFGLLSQFAVKYGFDAAKAKSPMASKANIAAASTDQAARLTREAEQQVSQQVLAPGNPKYKGVATKIAPDVLDRGMQGDRLALTQAAEDLMAKSGAEIDAAWKAHQQPLATQNVLQTLDQRIKDLQVGGADIPTAAGKVQALTQLRDYLAKLGDLSKDDFLKIRDEMYDAAEKAKGYQVAGNEHIADMGWAARETGSAMREAQAAQVANLTGPNADYTFAKRLRDVLDPNVGRPKQTNYVPTGVTGGMATAGAIAGAKLLEGIPVVGKAGALIGSQLLPKLKAFLASPEFQLASAQKKMALADALSKGDVGGARSLMLQISALAPRGVPGWAATPATASTPDNRPR